VSSSGQVLDSRAMVQSPGNEAAPCLAKDGGFTMLMAYRASTADYRGRTYNVPRVFGMFKPYPGVTEGSCKPQTTSRKLGASIVRGVLMLPRDMTEIRPGISDRVPRPVLLDACGRKVLDLHTGANDVSRLSPGVYFVRENPVVARVVITR
jgi:hypothetical protein